MRGLTFTEHDVLPHGVSSGFHYFADSDAFGVDMYTYRTEVMTKARFYEGSDLRIERLAWRGKHFVNNRRQELTR